LGCLPQKGSQARSRKGSVDAHLDISRPDAPIEERARGFGH